MSMADSLFLTFDVLNEVQADDFRAASRLTDSTRISPMDAVPLSSSR